MKYIGDFAEDATVYVYFTTSDGSGGAVAPSSAFEAADVKIYKNGSATEKTTTNGLTMTSPFDSITGLHLLAIDTSVDTGDAGFWVAGADYTIVLSPDETVDSQTVVAALAQFSIENRFDEVNATQISGDAVAADNLEAAYDGTGYDVGGIDVSELNQIVDDLIDAGRLDVILDAIKAKTDQLAFSKANEVDANIKSTNDVTIVGDGSGTPFNV